MEKLGSVYLDSVTFAIIDIDGLAEYPEGII